MTGEREWVIPFKDGVSAKTERIAAGLEELVCYKYEAPSVPVADFDVAWPGESPSVYQAMLDDCDRQIALAICGENPAAYATGSSVYADVVRAHDALKRSERRLLRRIGEQLWQQSIDQVIAEGLVKFAVRSVRRAIGKVDRRAYHGTRKQRNAERRKRRALYRLTPLIGYEKRRPTFVLDQEPFAWAFAARYSATDGPPNFMLVTQHV